MKQVKLLKLEDIECILHFIKKGWGDNHILANAEFVKYTYFSKVNELISGDLYAFFDNDNNISALFGSTIGNEDATIVNAMLWRSSHLGAGLAVLDEFLDKNRKKMVSGVGAQPTTILLMKNRYSYKVGSMKQYIRKVQEGKMTSSARKINPEIRIKRSIKIDEPNTKERQYINWRFVNNPFLDYIYVLEFNKLQAIFRKVWIGGKRFALRLIYNQNELKTLLDKSIIDLEIFCQRNNIEYIDIWTNRELHLDNLERINENIDYPLYTMPPIVHRQLTYFQNNENELTLSNGDQDRQNTF